MAKKQLTPIDMNGLAVTNLPVTPTNANDASSKSYTDTKLPGTAFSGTSKITVGTSAPSSPSVGDIWVDTN